VAAHRAVVIPNGRDPLQFHPRTAPADAVPATLIFVGAMTPQKQPDRFVEVVGRLRAEGRSFRAMLVGSGPLAASMASSAAAHGVELLGSRSDVPELLRRADVLVFTSRPTGEGMPGVLIEAGLSGLPAVSTPVPGAATVVAGGRTGVIVDDSVGSMAHAVGQLLDDPVRLAAMGVAARSRCESLFSLDLMAERWRAALQPMVGAQDGAARRGGRVRGRRAIAFRRSMRARRGSSHS
jgi:glycosyltransferase involved in cell wall biosynthesis